MFYILEFSFWFLYTAEWYYSWKHSESPELKNIERKPTVVFPNYEHVNLHSCSGVLLSFPKQGFHAVQALGVFCGIYLYIFYIFDFMVIILNFIFKYPLLKYDK